MNGIFIETKTFLVITTFLNHQWKSFWRSRNAGKGLAIQILIGFFLIYMLVSAISLGFFLQKILKQAYPSQDIIQVFCGYMLYYFSIDIISRFMLQELPTLSIQPYLVLPIKRSELIRFLNIRSLFTIFNLIPLLIFTPFVVTSIAKAYGAAASACFLVSIMSLIVFNHFIILYIKRKSIINSWWMVGFFAAMVAFALADHFQIFSLSHISTLLFSFILQHYFACAILIALAVFAYFNNYSFLLKNLYLEDIVAKSKKKEGADYTFLNRYGAVGELVGLDLKLILRNKRPRYVATLSLLFLFYGLIFYKQQFIRDGWWGVLFVYAIFILGMFINNYGQFLFAWQSSHFDGMMASNLSVKTYIKSRFVLFNIVSTIILLLTSFYGFLNWKLLIVQLAAYLYGIGIFTVITIYFATYNFKAIDIGKKATFNFQGMDGSRWLYALAVLLVPTILYLPFALIFNSWTGIAVVAMLGLASFLLQNWWVDLLTKEFLKRKYQMLAGFREK